jgi:hypothetical protein
MTDSVMESIAARDAAPKEARAHDSEHGIDRQRDAWPGIYDMGVEAGYVTEAAAETARGLVAGWAKATPSERWAARTLAWELTCALRLGVDESGGQLRTRSTTTRKQAPRKRKA